jgi:hypothetical protein
LGRVKKPALRGGRKSSHGFPGTPPSNPGPVEDQVCQMWQMGQLGWAAGFIDGDGCIGTVPQIYSDRQNPTVRIRVVIVQNHHGVLERIQNVLNCGGHLNKMKHHISQNRDCYQLCYDGSHAVEIVMKLRDFLVRKKPEADACLHLFIDGQLSRHPGRKGVSPEVREIRRFWVDRIKNMK